MVEVVRQVVVRAPRDAVYGFLKTEGTDHRLVELSSAMKSIGRVPSEVYPHGPDFERMAANLTAMGEKLKTIVRANPWLGKEGSALLKDLQDVADQLKSASAANSPVFRGVVTRERVSEEVPQSRIAFLADAGGKGMMIEYVLDEMGDSTAVTVRVGDPEPAMVANAEIAVIGSVRDLLGFEHGYTAKKDMH